MVDAGTVVATHLNHPVHIHAAGIARTGRSAATASTALAKESPKLVEDLTPKLLPLSTLQSSAEPPRRERAYPRHAHHMSRP